MNHSILKQLELFQICDSTFPIGSFNHSFGMETYLRTDEIISAKEFEEWLLIYLKTQFAYNDGLVIRLCHEALEVNEPKKLWDYDEIITVSSVSKETRDGTKMIAKQMIQLILDLYDIPLLKEYQQLMLNKDCYGHPAIVFAIFTYIEGFNSIETIMFYGYSVLSTMIQNAVRAIPIGQRDGQIILKNSLEYLESMTQDIINISKVKLGANMPGMEVSQMQHEIQDFRLFMS